MINNDGTHCRGKLAFDSKKEAIGAAVLAKHKYGTKLKVYKCRYCGMWHIASDYDN